MSKRKGAQNTMSYRLDYNEPIYRVVRRLRQDHKEIDRRLEKASETSENGNLKVAVSLMNATKTEILRHAVEEEARLARVIMKSNQTRNKSEESVKILQDHRRIKEFFEDKLPHLLDENSPKEAKRQIQEFVDMMIEHHREEERETFSLALEASSKR
jgi:hypothetical protein